MTEQHPDATADVTPERVGHSGPSGGTIRVKVSLPDPLVTRLRDRAREVGVSVSALVAVLLDLALRSKLSDAPEPKAAPARATVEPTPAPTKRAPIIRTPDEAREHARPKAGTCPAFAPVGTRCKVCGNVHTTGRGQA